jgi:hypothetical protein
MTRMRKSFDGSVKAKVALEAMKGEKTPVSDRQPV